MKKIGFVVPWFGENIPGGAEMALRGITEHLYQAGVDIEILSTCVKEFSADWHTNYHSTQLDSFKGMPVRRFKVRKGDLDTFRQINYKLMHGVKITRKEEETFIREMINSTDLYKYMEEHQEEYDLFVFIPYMFGPTYYGAKVCLEKAVLIPCFHDESYAYMSIFKETFSKVAGMAFNAQPECELANRLYDLSDVITITPGLGLDTDMVGSKEDFVKEFGIKDPFILYAGRKDEGKNVGTLVKYFAEYKARHDNPLKLVLIGGGQMKIPKEIQDDVYDLGFVDIQSKYNAYAAASLLCQPSKNESFSFVIMESWLCHRPVLVHDGCPVTKHFAKTSNGGLYFGNYFEFEGCVDYILEHPEEADAMGELGREFVLSHFAWDVVVKNYIDFFEKIIEKNEKRRG